MRVALLQYSIIWGNKAENLRLTELRLAELVGKADVALLPEMFTTGFCVDNPDLAEEMDGETVQLLYTWAAKYDIAIAGSFIATENQQLYNRGFFIKPDGSADFVDKRHLYARAGESNLFTPGDKRVITEYKGVRFCLLICYDLRFPVWSRNRSGQDYDILLYSANWPEVRIGYWDVLLAARGTENQCAVCAVNCVGTDGLGLVYSGHSMALDTRLEKLVSFADYEEGTKIATIDVAAIHHFREHSPLWQDSDKFEIIT